MGYIIILILILICIVGNVEIIKKKYPAFPLVISDFLMILQTMTVLGGDGQIVPIKDMTIVTFVAYNFGYFIMGILSLTILALHIKRWNKITGKTDVDK